MQTRTIQQFQFHNVAERPNPTISFRDHGNDGPLGANGQRASVMRRRISGVLESLLPCLETSEIPEHDFAKQVFSSARNPRFGDKATPLERFGLVSKEVDDVVGDFWWETWIRHNDFGQGERSPWRWHVSPSWYVQAKLERSHRTVSRNVIIGMGFSPGWTSKAIESRTRCPRSADRDKIEGGVSVIM